MKKLFIAIAAIVCCAFTSCVNNDNPVETVEDNIPLADAIKLHTAPQSFHKLDTDEVQPIYVVVDNAYEVDGQKKFYDLSQITSVKTSNLNDFFTVDASMLAKYGYFKLIPNDEDFIDEVDMGYRWTGPSFITLTNKKGETYTQEVTITYLNKNEFDLKETCSVADLGENNEYIIKVTQLFGLPDYTFKRYGDEVKNEMEYLYSAEIKDDGFLHVVTDGLPTEPDDPNTMTYTFKRRLVGSPTAELPEGEGILVNFRIKLELTVTE